MSTLALIVCSENGSSSLVDVLMEEHEIGFMEQALQAGAPNPLKTVYERRAEQVKKDEEFGDYVETLLACSGPNPQIQKQCVQWLQSKIKIDEFLKKEREAAEIIARYALPIYQKNHEKRDFILVSTTTKIRIRIFEISGA